VEQPLLPEPTIHLHLSQPLMQALETSETTFSSMLEAIQLVPLSIMPLVYPATLVLPLTITITLYRARAVYWADTMELIMLHLLHGKAPQRRMRQVNR
jgi:uncharacterized RDD family membrane protein YckC